METVSAEKADEKAEQLLRRAKQLREELQADVKGPAVTRVQPANWRPDPVEWSTRAVAELELILAEDPMCTGERDKEESNGSRKDDDDTQREREEKVPMTSQPPLPISDVRSLPAAGSTLRGFDGLNLKLETLDLTTFGLRKIRDADGIWLRCRVVLGQSAKTEVEEILLRCPEIQGHRVDIQHSSHQQKQASVDWQTVASEPLQLGLLISSKTKTKGRESREKGHALTPVAEANLLWFAALLEPGATCPFTCELKSVESTGAKNPPVGRLHFSMELTVSSAGDSPQGQADSSEVYLRVWLNTVQGYFSGARAILKLGPSQELLVPVQPMREDLGHLGGGAVSAQPIWNTRDGICSSPSPPCIFVQIWQGAELCGLAKLILSQLPPESCQNIALQGYEKLLEGELDIFAVTTDRSIGKLHVLVHAGSQEVLQVLQAPAPPDCEFTLEDAAAGIMILACHDIEELEQSITQQLQTGPLNLRACEPGLTKKEADSLTVWMKAETSTNEGSVWMALKPRIEAAHQSFDQLVKDVGEVSSTSVALDFLDVAAPSKLQRQDIARVLRLRGIELGWNTLESLFLALGCQSSQALPAAYFTRLFKARAEKRIADIATLRQLEGQVLAWAGQLESPRKLVNSFSKSDGTMDLMGLKVLLSQGPVSRNDLDRLAGWRFEELGARPGGSVPSESVLQWLTREIKVQQPEKGTQACLPIDGNTAQQEQAHLDQRLLAFSHKNVKVDEPGHQHELNPVSTHIERSVGYPVVPTEVATGVSWETVERKERLEARVEERAERASIQLSQPVRRIDDLQKLEEAFSTLLKLPLHRVKVFGAEGASRICLLIREESHQGHLGHPKGLSAEAALRDLAQQMRDPAKLTATALDIYFS